MKLNNVCVKIWKVEGKKFINEYYWFTHEDEWELNEVLTTYAHEVNEDSELNLYSYNLEITERFKIGSGLTEFINTNMFKIYEYTVILYFIDKKTQKGIRIEAF